MKLCKFLIIGLVLCNFVFGIDVVKLTNGDVLRGEVIEQNTKGRYIQIKFADGNERRIKTSEIEEIRKEDSIRPEKPNVITQSLREKPGKSLVTAGLYTLAISYGATVGFAAFQNGSTAFIPVIGPFLQLSNTSYRALCIVSGVVQSVGLGMVLTGLIQNAAAERETSFSFSPVLTPDSTGLNVAYRF